MSQDGIETYRPCALSRKGTRPQRGVRVVGGMVGFRSLTRLPFFIGQCASGRRFLLHPPLTYKSYSPAFVCRPG